MRLLFGAFVLVMLIASVLCYQIGSAEAFGVLGSVASVAGLVLTVYVAFAVAKIRMRYVRQAVLRSCVDRLEGHLKALGAALRKKDSDKLQESFSKCSAVIDELVKHFPDVEGAEWIGTRLRNVEARRPGLDVVAQGSELISRISGVVERLRIRLVQIEWGDHDV